MCYVKIINYQLSFYYGKFAQNQEKNGKTVAIFLFQWIVSVDG